jgi:hypothetical protein
MTTLTSGARGVSEQKRGEGRERACAWVGPERRPSAGERRRERAAVGLKEREGEKEPVGLFLSLFPFLFPDFIY